MDIYDPAYIRRTLQPLGFTFSKLRGQNFLTDASVPERMAKLLPSLGGGAPLGVLEIGPGFGALTKPLLTAAERLVAVEVDRRLSAVLEARYADMKHFTLLPEDALKLNLNELADRYFQGLTPVVAANLPYAITSPLLEAMIKAERYRAMLVMIQREVARRLTAKPGTPDYGAFTLYTQVFCESGIEFDIGPEAFVPRPAVSSSVVRLIRRDKPLVPEKQQALFFRLTRAAFGQRRKTLRNALASAFSEQGADDTAKRIAKAGLNPQVRGETLGIPEFLRLCETFTVEGQKSAGDEPA